MKRKRIHFPSRMAKYFKAERETKNRKFFDKPPKRGRFKGKVSWAISRAKLIHNGSSRELRKTLVFIRFDEEGTIYQKDYIVYFSMKIMESVNLTDIYKKLKEIERNMATKRELAQTMETFCILSNEDTLQQIESSERDIKRGKFKKISSVEDL